MKYYLNKYVLYDFININYRYLNKYEIESERK